MDGNVGDLIVAWPVEARLSQRADETLMIVGCRIDEMAEQLQVCPLSFATGSVPVAGIEGGKDGLALGDEMEQVIGHSAKH